MAAPTIVPEANRAAKGKQRCYPRVIRIKAFHETRTLYLQPLGELMKDVLYPAKRNTRARFDAADVGSRIPPNPLISARGRILRRISFALGLGMTLSGFWIVNPDRGYPLPIAIVYALGLGMFLISLPIAYSDARRHATLVLGSDTHPSGIGPSFRSRFLASAVIYFFMCFVFLAIAIVKPLCCTNTAAPWGALAAGCSGCIMLFYAILAFNQPRDDVRHQRITHGS